MNSDIKTNNQRLCKCILPTHFNMTCVGRIRDQVITDKEELELDGYTDDFARKVRFKETLLRGDPRKFQKDLDDFDVRDGDVWLCSYMRSGSTWAKEMVWRVANDCRLDDMGFSRDRFPYFDLFIMRSGCDDQSYKTTFDSLNKLPSPRFLKTHLPFHLLPRQLRDKVKSVKLIYIARNPKDVCVSLYYYYKHFYNFQGEFTKFCDLFLTDKVLYAPYWNNVLSYWKKREEMDILFLTYETMITDLKVAIRKTAKFFGKNPKDDEVVALEEYLKFDNFRNNPLLNNQDIDQRFAKMFNLKDSYGFVRKGTVNQWKSEMSEEMIRRFDEWVERNLHNSDYVCE